MLQSGCALILYLVSLGFRPRVRCSRFMSRLSDQTLVCFEFLDPTKKVFDFVRTSSDMFRLSRPAFLNFSLFDPG